MHSDDDIQRDGLNDAIDAHLDDDEKIVDCSVAHHLRKGSSSTVNNSMAAIEQSLVMRGKLSHHEDDDIDDDEEGMEEMDDDEMNPLEMNMGSDMLEHDDEDIEEEENEMDEEHDGDDAPENLCIKNTNKENSCGSVSNNNNNKDNNSNSNNCSSNNNRIGLSLKDIRHLNRPPSHCRQNLFPGAGAHLDYATAAAVAHHQQEQQKLAQQRHHEHQRRTEKHEQERRRRDGEQHDSKAGQPSNTPNSQAFLEQHSENMKRELLESRLENDNAYIDHMDLSLAAAAARSLSGKYFVTKKRQKNIQCLKFYFQNTRKIQNKQIRWEFVLKLH